MSASARIRALASFKALHRARQQVFHGDEAALVAGRLKINEEFRQHMQEKDPEKIEELIKTASDTANYLKTAVVQAKAKSEGQYEMQFTRDTHFDKNTQFPEHGSTLPDTPRRRKSTKPCS